MTTNYSPPMTPRINKRLQAAPITPKSQRPRRLYHNTPLTPSTGDRFIPNRARTDVASAQRALRPHHHHHQQRRRRRRQQDTHSNFENEARLRKVLFSESNNDKTSIMSFGPTTSSSGWRQAKSLPFAQDFLRGGEQSDATIATGIVDHRYRSAVEVRWTNCLDAPGILGHHDLTLVSRNDQGVLACALGEKIYLLKESGNAELLDESDSCPYTCVQFSEDGKFLALGLDGVILIYRIDWSNGHYIERELYHVDGYVTAIAWYGSSRIVACGEDGIQLIDLDQPVGADVRYGTMLEATTLVWNSQNNIIVAANREGNIIQIFDDQHHVRQLDMNNTNNISPRLSLQHDGVRCLEFSPLQPNLLASGGKDGVKFWNVRSGMMRGEIKTDSPVAGIVFSETRNEIIIADEGRVAVYSLCPKVTMLAERKIEGKKMTSMTAGVNGKLFCVAMQSGEDSLLVFTVTRRATTSGKRRVVMQSGLGTLKVPVIR